MANQDNYTQNNDAKPLYWKIISSPAIIGITSICILLIFITIILTSPSNGGLNHDDPFIDDLNSLSLKNDQQQLLMSEKMLATRKSMIADVIQDATSELNDPKNEGDTLSDALLAKISGVSNAMTPYMISESDAELVSPERGQLFNELLEMDIDANFFVDKILPNVDFSYADLSGMTLSDINLEKGRFDNANFQNAKFTNVNLRNAELNKANFSGARLSNADLRDAYLNETNLTNTYLIKAKLQEAELSKAIFDRTNLKDADLTNANLNYAELKDAYFYNVNLGTQLKGLHLKRVDLSKARLENTDFTGAMLDSVVVSRKDWIAYVKDELKVKGTENFENLYTVSTIDDPMFGISYIIVKKRN
jgi:uncharacterized protein YjbI with pentapeptide repeats